MDIYEFCRQLRVPLTVIHVLAVCIGMGAALISDVFFSFFSKDKKLSPSEIAVLSFLAAMVSWGLVAIAISGVGIFLSDVPKYTHSVKFLAKMSILGVLLANGYILNKYIWPHLLNKNFFVSKKERNVRRLAFVCGAISVISWLSVCTLGVLDSVSSSYGTIMSLYVGMLCIGILVALVVERKELN